MLLGDAAHTAHYSIGSGTKLAMEDAIALVEALRDEPDELRVRAVRATSGARRSSGCRSSRGAARLWWESFPARMHLPVAQLMVAYMSRAGNVPLERFAGTSPDVVDAALAQYGRRDDRAGRRSPSRVLERPAARGAGDGLDDRSTDVLADPWDVDGDAVVARARATRRRRVPRSPARPTAPRC